jgi:hypothetical protein
VTLPGGEIASMLLLVPLRALHFWKMGLARIKSLSSGGLGTISFGREATERNGGRARD